MEEEGAMKEFGNVITAMVTPFTKKLEVDYPKATELAEKLAREGSDSLVVCGTTGESPTLTHEEKLQLFEAVKKAVGNKIPLLAGTGTNCTRTTVQLTKEAETIGMDGVLLVAPYYNKPPQEGLYHHFRAVAESTSLPVVLYNIPGRTGVNMAPETTARLAEIPNIVGIKEASGSVEQVAEILRQTEKVMELKVTAGASALLGRSDAHHEASSPYGKHVPLQEANRFSVWSGDDSLTLPFLSVGARGVVSVASHLVGIQIRNMINYFLGGNVREAASIHLKLLPLFKGLFVTTNPILLKAALAMTGFQVGGVRPPLMDAGEKEKAALKEILKHLQLLSET